jgi:two-component system OmpR family sensor kinase
MPRSRGRQNNRASSMRYFASLRGRLSLVSGLLFLVIVVLGLAGIWGLSDFNAVTKEVRDRWLPDTRLLGDLNNFTSDYRAAEANCLLASTPAEFNDSLHDIALLRQAVLRAQHGYEQIRHGADEAQLYRAFDLAWNSYVALADRVIALASAGHRSDAVTLYLTASRTTYDAASDALGRLTDYNVARAGQASESSALAYQRARLLMLGSLVAAGLMLAAAISYVRRSISAPLLALARAMRRLAANDTAIEINDAQREDEIGEMARAVVVFRSNAIDLAQSQHGLAQQAAMLEEKLAHEQRLAEMQRNFISTIAHEFRTPLTQIDAHAQRMIRMRDGMAVEDTVNRADRIRISVVRIIRLIDNLLSASRLTDGNPSLYFHPEPIDLAAVLHEVCRSHQETSPEVQILEDLGTPSLPMVGDPKLLFQVFSNLLSNAIKYSPRLTPVRLTTQSNNGVIWIAVRDWGIGIPLADQANIFERYSRGSNVAGIVGTGIGLHLVMTVVRLHGGDVTVESVEGEGTLVNVYLPKQPTHKAERDERILDATQPSKDRDPVRSDRA